MRLDVYMNTGWDRSRFAVVHMENNKITSIRINCEFFIFTTVELFSPPCIISLRSFKSKEKIMHKVKVISLTMRKPKS